MQFFIDPYLVRLVASPTYGQTPTLPTLVRDDLLPITVYFVNTATGAYVNESLVSLKFAIGAQNAYPSGGTFTATFGADTTSALAWDISPAALQTALCGLTSIGSGNCSVIGVAGVLYAVTFVGTLNLAPQSLITIDAANLTPTSSAFVTHDTVGTGIENEVQAISFKQVPPLLVSSWSNLGAPTYGWTGSAQLSKYKIAQLLLASATTSGLIVEIDGTDSYGNRTTWAQQPVTVADDIIGNAPITPAANILEFGTATILSGTTSIAVSLTGCTSTALIIPFWTGSSQGTLGITAGTDTFTIQSSGPVAGNTVVGYYVVTLS